MATKRSKTRGATPRRPSVGIILVNWNGWQDTVVAIKSVQDSLSVDHQIIVVDNGSIDDSVQQLRKLGSAIHLVENGQNLGFAGACNVGVYKAEQLSVDYVFFLNNDAFVTPHTIGRLVQASRELSDSAILGSVVRFEETRELQFYGSTRSDIRGRLGWFPRTEEQFSGRPDLIESDFILGAAMFAPISLVGRIGEFDERFFLNFEETDWCYRARRNGVRCFVVKSALTYHKGSASVGSLGGPLQTYFLVRNQLLFSEKHVSPLWLLWAYAKALKRLAARLVRELRGRDEGRSFDPTAQAHLLAVRDYVLRRFGDCPPIVRHLAQQFRDSSMHGA